MGVSVIINKEICVGCKSCILDCPAKAIRLTDDKAEVTKPCITCGHCVAVCPVNAVSIPEYAMDEVAEYQKESFTIPANNYLNAVKFRRSIRNFRPEPVAHEVMERIIDAGRYTATARNLQACTFVVVQDGLVEFKKLFWEEFPFILKVLEETKPQYVGAFMGFYEKWKNNPADDTFFFNTTSLVIVASDNTLDGGLASANIENMAVAEGAGVLYSGYLQRTIAASPALLKWLGLEGRALASCMLVGYPAVSYKRTAPRRKGDVRFL